MGVSDVGRPAHRGQCHSLVRGLEVSEWRNGGKHQQVSMDSSLLSALLLMSLHFITALEMKLRS